MASDDGHGRQVGVLEEWNDDRGFGFITPTSGGSRVFVHVSAFPRGPRPVTGSEITYLQTRDGRDRARASAVRYVSAEGGAQRVSGVSWALAVAVLFFALLGGLLLLEDVPPWVTVAYGLLSVVTFGMYRADKSAAVRGSWRISEATLHTVAVLGGWPGALVARPMFRHKTTKQPFRTLFWCTVVVNCLALGWLVYQR